MVHLAVIAAFVAAWWHYQVSSTNTVHMNVIMLLVWLHYHTDALAARSASKRLRPTAESEDDSEGMSEEDVSDGDEAISALRPVKRRRAATRLDSRSVSECSSGSDAAEQSESQGASSSQLRKGARGSPAPSFVVRARYHRFLLICW